MWTIDTLEDLRATVKEALENGLEGVSVLDYTESRFTPPVAIVTPDEPFIVPGEAFGTWNIRIKVVLIGRSATDKVAANALDRLIFESINALGEFDLMEVSAPQEVTLRQRGQDTTYWGSVLTLEFNTSFKEAI